ncbi:MAG: VWA domain-containing protein [Peptococcaceae bacterium]|jgi:uncharacterized protein YegL|nr:VWA domain-containing protein [Peptococcaceae bacterium]
MNTKHYYRYIPFLISFFVAILVLVSTALFALDIGQFDLDVIFVIDNSESMFSSDPSRLALTASNLFLDMCEGSDSRVGYVMFTHSIAASQPLTNIDTFRTELKRAISSTQYVNGGYTDIALGLEKAYELLELDALNGKSARKPVVILLSDGNTDLPIGASRTTAESLAALDRMKNTYTAAKVPIYTIGLNYDGTLDFGTIKSISDSTTAIAQETKSANELPDILRRIYGALTGSNSKSNTVIATGQPQSFPIQIENTSIYKATITIMASNEVRDVSIADPSGIIYSTTDPAGKVSFNWDPSNRYILLSLYRPLTGDWTLTFTGTRDDVVSIDLLSVYDMQLIMEDPLVSKRQVSISWHLEDADGSNIADPDLLDGLTVSLIANGEVYPFPQGESTATFEMLPGDYIGKLSMSSADIEKESENSKSFTIPDKNPISLLDPAVDTKRINLVTIFWKRKEINLNEMIRYSDDNRPLSLSLTSGGWSDYLEIDYDRIDEKLTVTAKKSGRTETEVTVSESDGNQIRFYISTRILSGIMFILITAAVLLAVAGIIVFLKLKNAPRLSDPMRDFAIQMEIPPEEVIQGKAPPQARIRLPYIRANRTLMELLSDSREYNATYSRAFENIMWFPHGLVLAPKTREALEVTIPVNSGFTVHVGKQKIEKAEKYNFSKKEKLTIELVRNDNQDFYRIILGDGASSDYDSYVDSVTGGAFEFTDTKPADNTGKDDFDF